MLFYKNRKYNYSELRILGGNKNRELVYFEHPDRTIKATNTKLSLFTSLSFFYFQTSWLSHTTTLF